MERQGTDSSSPTSKIKACGLLILKGPLLLVSTALVPLLQLWNFIFYGKSFSLKSRYIGGRQSKLERLDPKEAAADFAECFERDVLGGRLSDAGDELSVEVPNWFLGSYSQALEKASSEMRYLLVYLQSDDHDDTIEYNRSVLCSAAFANLLKRRQFVIWGGNVRNTEAFQVFQVLQGSTFPYLALIYPDGSQLKLADKFLGFKSAEEIVARLEHAMEKLDRVLQAKIYEMERNKAERAIVQQQEAAYQASLRADQEKDRIAREAREHERQLAIAEEQKLEARLREREQKRRDLSSEPDSSLPNVAKVSIKLPNSERLIRAFHESETVGTIYDFVDSHELNPLPPTASFVLVSSYPRKEYRDRTCTLAQANIKGTVALLVEQS